MHLAGKYCAHNHLFGAVQDLLPQCSGSYSESRILRGTHHILHVLQNKMQFTILISATTVILCPSRS